MSPSHRALLLVDAIVNLVLGALLLLFPFGADELLGLPVTGSAFFPSILGGVLVGIAVALLEARAGRSGLGIDGAIAINLIGSGVLLAWLIIRPPDIPVRGLVVLWSVAVLVPAVAVAEIFHRARTTADRQPPQGGTP